MIPPSESFAVAWQGAQPRPPVEAKRESKKNFAERFSRCLADRLAIDLRDILGDDVQTAAEIGRSRGDRGATGLDVICGNSVSGLGLGISIKSVTFPDPKAGRFTKNYTRIDHELRSEAIDHHERQPYAVLVALLFLPSESATDGADAPSSFGRAVQRFRPRIGRSHPQGDLGRFERMFIGLYEVDDSPRIGFFDVAAPPPKRGVPRLCTWKQMLDSVVGSCEERSSGISFRWFEDSLTEGEDG